MERLALRLQLRSPLFLLLMACAFGLAACGRSEPRRDDFAPSYQPPADAESGGTLRVLASSEIDSLDPGVTINQFGWMVSEATQRTLIKIGRGSEKGLRPDIAVAPPKVDYRKGLVEFKLRDDVRFSPPVDRVVRAGDFKYAIERSLLPGVANGYVNSYLNNLVGYAVARREAIRSPHTAPDIVGITTPDRRTLRLHFKGRVPPVAIDVLALPLGAPVPAAYARRFDATIPSTYDQHVVATGPYMVANDASGSLTGFQPGIATRLVRNPSWKRSTDDQPAYLDEVRIENGYTNTDVASRRILNGQSMVNGDFPPEPAFLRYAATERPDQLVMMPARSTIYASLNTTIKPLDDLDVRRAIVAATNRELIRLSRGGAMVGPLATHFIPPGVSGFEEAGGLEGPGFDFLQHPEGDEQVAASYMKRAGYEDGVYDGDAELLMVTDSTAAGRQVAELVRQVLESLEIPVRIQSVSRDVMYSRYCNVPRAEVAICPNVGWLTLVDDPQTVLDEAFSGDEIRRVNNSNWSQLAVPSIDRQIRRARWITDSERRAQAWGRIDREITRLAPAIPQIWSKVPYVFSSNVNLVIDRATASPSLPLTSLTGDD